MSLVSAIIPTFNYREYLPAAIDSALEQQGVDIEVIVVDDGSTDGTYQMLKDMYGKRIRLFRQENCGESAARNLGAMNTKGEIVALF